MSGLILCLALVGCKEKDVPFVIDQDELQAYVTTVPQAVQLFRSNGMYPATSYDVPHLDAVYQDKVLSHKTFYGFDLVPLRMLDGSETPDSILYADYGIMGMLREAWVIITDEFTIETVRMFPADTVVDTTNRKLVRYGFFLKLGDDSKEYVGWVLWGYRGLEAYGGTLRPTVTARMPDTVGQYVGDYSLYTVVPRSRSSAIRRLEYIRLSEIPRINNGELLALETEWIGNPQVTKRDYPLVAFDGQNGYVTKTLVKQSRESYRDTLDIRNGSPQRYNFFFMQSFHDDEFYHTFSWCVPYQL
ncbi:MAG: hypothetical protein JSU65_02525 [Candidatus Zixiibacteriota bacterium]|nr:MAG: hypothetical protein JSU65_02525 [candidate division Zixibacteria bacterium]